MPDWVDTGFNEYSKRFPNTIKLKLKELNAPQRSKSTSTLKCMEQERDSILAAHTENNLLIALDERGKHLTSTKLSQHLSYWQQQSRNIDCVIGGADGLHEDIKNKADELISLSRLTLPHAMVRVILAEQFYRAWTITQNHPYHRE